MNQEEDKKARLLLIRLLARRSWFSHELFKQLTQKGFSRDVVERLIATAQASGYLNDQELATRYMQSLKQRGYGKLYIMQKLRTKAGPLFQFEWDEECPVEAILAILQRRYVKQLATNDVKLRNKVIAALVRKGFALDDIFSALRHKDV